jgi:hypothetical protein
MFMNTARPKGSTAGSHGDLSALEVAEKFLPLLFGWGSVFFTGSSRSTAGNESPMGVDCFFGVDGFVAHGGVDVGMPADDLGNVWR